jgi:hypothetical protein
MTIAALALLAGSDVIIASLVMLASSDDDSGTSDPILIRRA